VFAEFETNLRRERQLEGINAAKARGVYKGRKPSIDAAEVIPLRREEKLGPVAIARRLGIGRASVYRLLGKHNGNVSANGDSPPMVKGFWRGGNPAGASGIGVSGRSA
jgi:DNA invertase Pin-like site-specific DNA recombinase